MTTKSAKRAAAGFYLAVAFICGSVMALQILQSRIFSVVTWYHLSFLAISIAMFGLTLGAVAVYRGDREDQRKNLGKLLAENAFKYSILTVAALLVQMRVPILDSNFRLIVLTLPLVAAVTASAYYYAGKVVSLCLTRSSYPVGRVYAADMIGASGGCLAAIGLMKLVDAPSAVLLIAGCVIAISFMFHTPKAGRGRNLMIAAVVALAGFGLLNAVLTDRPLYPHYTKGLPLPRNVIEYEEWTPISRITVSPTFQPGEHAVISGPSPKMPANVKMDYKYLRADGAAGTYIVKFDGKNWDSVNFVQYDILNLVHSIPGIKSVGIIGVGGGRDLLSALYFGAKRVVALDVSSVQVDLLTKNQHYTSYSNIGHQPGVDVINSEARSWFTRTRETFDAIQMSVIDTWISSTNGAFALTENSLYTVDGWKVFLSRLNKNGVFNVSRFHMAESGCNDLCRLATIAVTALHEMGQKDPSKNIFIAHIGQIVTFIVGKNPLTKEQLDGLHKAADRLEFTVLASPRQEAKDKYLHDILHAKDADAMTQAIKDLPFDVSPSTDLRPFFFNQARIWHPFEVIEQASWGRTMGAQNLRGHAVATVNLYAIILFSIIASLLVLILPFRKAVKLAPRSFVTAGTVYFALIGLGFMFVEITLLQMMSMFLGHPVYGLGIVLFSMILSTGVGSFLSEHIAMNKPERLVIWALALMGYILFLSNAVAPLMNNFIVDTFAVRVALCVGLIFPCGLLMGFAFPTGMKLTAKVADKLTPWFWGINGATGVVASAFAMVISIGQGLPATLMTGAFCYGLLSIPAVVLLKQSKK